MIEWEYSSLYIDEGQGANPIRELNEAGKDGWELIHVDKPSSYRYSLWLKRPIPSPPAARSQEE